MFFLFLFFSPERKKAPIVVNPFYVFLNFPPRMFKNKIQVMNLVRLKVFQIIHAFQDFNQHIWGMTGAKHVITYVIEIEIEQVYVFRNYTIMIRVENHKKRTSPVPFLACKVATTSKHFSMSGIFA